MSLGAESYLEKSYDKDALIETFEKIQASVHASEKSLLLVDPNDNRRSRIVSLIGSGPGIRTIAVRTGAEALEHVRQSNFDCTVCSSHLPDMPVWELIAGIWTQPGRAELPTIVLVSDGLDRGEEAELKRVAEHAIVKTVDTTERLVEEAAVFLNCREEELTEEQRRIIEDARSRGNVLTGGKVLIVDDDVRNIFALTSGLERHNLVVLHAEGGKEGLSVLEKNPDIDLVLMDIMMPEMDGYETTRRIRQMPQFAKLPVIALTAKAMKGDREKCIAAGASDYIPKPVVLDELVSLLRVWLPQIHAPVGGSFRSNGDES